MLKLLKRFRDLHVTDFDLLSKLCEKIERDLLRCIFSWPAPPLAEAVGSNCTIHVNKSRFRASRYLLVTDFLHSK